MLIRYGFQNNIYDKNFTDKWENGGMPGQTDLPRLKDGRLGGAFWSAFVLCPKNGTDFSNENYAEGQSSVCYMCYAVPAEKRWLERRLS